MTKKELVAAIAKKAEVSQKDAAKILDAFTGVVEDELVAGNKLTVTKLGTFSTGVRAARTGKNPRTGETVEIKASKTVKMSACKALKDAVNK